MTTRLTPRIALLLVIPPLLWAANAVVGRIAVGTVPPLALNFVRWALAALLLLPLGWHVLRQGAAVRERRWHLAALGLFGMGCYNSLQYLALHTSTPLNVTLIASSSPVWMLGIGAVAYGVRPRARELGGAVLSILGVLLVLSRGDVATLAAFRFVPGDLYMLLAIFCWCLYSWQLARPPASMQGARRPAWTWAEFLLVQTLFGVAWSALFAGSEAALGAGAWQWRWWVPLLLLFVAVGPSIVAYRCWGAGVAAVGPAVAAFFSNLTPLFAALLSAALLGQPPRPYHGLAFALIVAGILVSSRR